jgi:hypothetical protein
MTMPTPTPDETPTPPPDEREASAKGKLPYEPPLILYAGNLHDVVAKSGPLFDFSLRRPARH